MANALGGGSGWVLLIYVAARWPAHQPVRGSSTARQSRAAIPILALDMYEHAYHIDFGANAKAYVDTFMRNIDWRGACRAATRTRTRWRRRGRSMQEEFGDLPASASRR